MEFHNSTQLYIRPAVNIGVRQQLQRRGIFDLPGGVGLWRRAGWLLLVLIPLMLSINILIVSAIQEVDSALVKVDGQRHELMDKKIGLLAQRAEILAPENMQHVAAEKLSLYLPSKRQIGQFNRRTGSFIYL